jgi:hypothetical protein
MGGLFGGGGGKPKLDPNRVTDFSNYDATKHGANVKPLERNPGLLGAPGVEQLFASWDKKSAAYDALYAREKKAFAERRGKPVDWSDEGRSASGIKKRRLSAAEDLYKLEQSIMKQTYRAPAGYQAPGTAPAPAAAPKPAAPAPAPAPVFTPSPEPGSSPAAAAAGSIVGTQLTGTLGTDTAKAGRKGGGGRRGRVKSLLSGLGGSGSETFGG